MYYVSYTMLLCQYATSNLLDKSSSSLYCNSLGLFQSQKYKSSIIYLYWTICDLSYCSVNFSENHSKRKSYFFTFITFTKNNNGRYSVSQPIMIGSICRIRDLKFEMLTILLPLTNTTASN